MTPKQIQNATGRIEDAGRPDVMVRQLAIELANASEQLAWLEAKQRSQVLEYRRFAEAWLGEALPDDAPVMALSNEQHQARLYFAAGMVAMFAECGLAWWTFETRWGVAGYYGAIAAIASALILHGIFGVWYEIGATSRPRESLRRLRRGALRIGGMGLLIGIVTGVIGRFVEGTLAIDLLPLLNTGLAITTVSLLIATAALFCAATLLGTSARLARAHDVTNRALRRTRAFVRTLTTSKSPTSASASTSTSAMVVLVPLFVLSASVWLTGCGRSGPHSPATATDDDRACTIDVIIDGSGSVVGLDEAWRALKQELPRVAETFACNSITFHRSDVNAWSRTLVHTISLASLRSANGRGGEIGQLANVVRAIREEALVRRRQEMNEGLTQLEDKRLLPPLDYESAASDVVGVIQHAALTHTERPLLIIYLTDGADTRHRTFPPIAPPQSDVRLLVLLAPAKAKDAERAFGSGKPMSEAEQYINRVAELKRAAPWVRVATSRARDIASLLRRADFPYSSP